MGIGSLETRRAIFLDRDGVLNEAVVRNSRPHPPDSLDRLVIVSDAGAALASLRDAGYLLIVVTNQPDVARGTQRLEVVEAINEALATSLPIDDFMVCYHDDRDGCACRKPQPGMLLEAARRHAISLNASVLVGDRAKDIQAGRRAGVRTVFVDKHYDEPPPEPRADATRTTLAEAAAWILANPV